MTNTFLKITKKNKNTFWFLISLDNFIPKHGKNIFIIKRKKVTLDFFIILNLLYHVYLKKIFFTFVIKHQIFQI